MKTILVFSLLFIFGCADWNIDPDARDTRGAVQNYTNSVNGPQKKRVDSSCMADCARAGYQYGLCESKCSY